MINKSVIKVSYKSAHEESNRKAIMVKMVSWMARHKQFTDCLEKKKSLSTNA